MECVAAFSFNWFKRMDTGFLQAFGTVFGILCGGSFLYGAVKIGRSWGSVSDIVATTAQSVEKIKDKQEVDGHALRDVQFILVGVDGKNGLRSDVLALKEWVLDADHKERRIANHSPNPGKRKSDKKGGGRVK